MIDSDFIEEFFQILYKCTLYHGLKKSVKNFRYIEKKLKEVNLDEKFSFIVPKAYLSFEEDDQENLENNNNKKDENNNNIINKI